VFILTCLSEEQLIKTDSTNILIRALTLGKKKGKVEPKSATKDNKGKVLVVEESKGKRCSLLLAFDDFNPLSIIPSLPNQVIIRILIGVQLKYLVVFCFSLKNYLLVGL
jgi:hypothetical protein